MLRSVPSLIVQVITALLISFCLVTPTSAGTQTLLSNSDGFYPRVVKLGHNVDPAKNGAIIASVTTFTGGGHEDIFVSHDEGASFTLAGKVEDSDFAKGLCCGGLYELPTAIGALPAGTLLWAGSVGGDTPAEAMQLRIYSSTDQGAHWRYLSNCATGSKPRSGGGLWEAEFTVAADGKLVCFYSDETQTGHSQVLRYVQSADGVTWSAPVDVVASITQADRPGMANIVKLPYGRYLMSFEMCGPLNCATFLKTSADGLDWGDANNHGAVIATTDGTTFWHTPTMIWAPVSGSATGQLVVQGQILVKNGAPQPGNGNTLLINSAGDGTGAWVAFKSPTAIAMSAGTAGNFCQNYSSPMLALDGGRKLLELASDFVGGNTCKTYFNVAPLGGVTASESTISVNKGASASGDVTLRSSANYSGLYNLSVSVPNLPADVVLSDSTVTLSANADTVVHVTVTPTNLASANKQTADVMYAGIRRKDRRFYPLLALLTVPLILGGCGDGGSSGGGSVTPPPATITTTYTGTLTATSATDQSVSFSTPFVVRISKTS